MMPDAGVCLEAFYLVIVAGDDNLFVFNLHHFDTFLNNMVSIVIFNVFLYPWLQLLQQQNSEFNRYIQTKCKI